MSALFGIFGENFSIPFQLINDGWEEVIKKKNIHIIKKGIQETFCHLPGINTIICGIGFKSYKHNFELYNSNDWDYTVRTDKVSELNGHFIIIRYSENGIKFINDCLGIRDIYLFQKGSSLLFSTNPLLISKYFACEIDYIKMGSHWLLVNQMKNRPFFKGMKRLGQGGKGEFNGAGLEVENRLFYPEINNETKLNLKSLLQGFVNSLNNSGKDVSLSMSGGMDSRFLFSIIQSSGIDFDLHTFGEKSHPDAKIAIEIAQQFELEHSQYESRIHDFGTDFVGITRFISGTLLLASASEYYQFMHYPKLHSVNKIIIDAGWGELTRRGLFNSLLYKGNSAIIQKKPESLYELMKSSRPVFFSKDLYESMKAESIEEIREALEGMPDVVNFGIEEWLDLFAIRYKMPSNLNFEQTRLDEIAMCITPYAQKDFCNYIFNMPLYDKKDGRLIKEIIRKDSPGLQSIPLVKGRQTYPYNMKTLSSKSLVKIKRILSGNQKGESAKSFLDSAEEFIRDTFNSTETRSTGIYDINKLDAMINRYYGVDGKNSSAMDWLMTFEIFRKQAGELKV